MSVPAGRGFPTSLARTDNYLRSPLVSKYGLYNRYWIYSDTRSTFLQIFFPLDHASDVDFRMCNRPVSSLLLM